MEKLGVQAAYLFVVTTAMQDARPIGGAQGMQPYTSGATVREHEKELHRSPAMGCLGRGPETKPWRQ